MVSVAGGISLEEVGKEFGVGQVDLERQTLDVDVRANLKGVAGLATELVSRILEFHGAGPLKDVRWSMSHGPVKEVKAAVDVAGEAVKGVGEVLKDVGEIPEEFFERRPGFLIPNKEREEKR